MNESNLPAPTELGVKYNSLAEKRFKSPCIKSVHSLNNLSLLGFIYMLISKTYIKCGQSIESDKLKTSATLFTEELLDDYPFLTIKEIEKAFKDGYKGHYGEYFGLNVLTFVKWVDFFVKNLRQKELKKAADLSVKILPEISESTKRTILIESTLKAFDEFVSVGKLPMICIHIFRFLDSSAILDSFISLEDKKLIKEEAVKTCKKQFNPLNARGVLQKAEFEKIYSNMDSDNTGRVEVMEQKLTLKFFFGMLKVKKQNLKELL